MTHSSLTNGVQITSDSNARTQKIDRFIVHHAATTSLSAILSLFQPGGREVSANYALGSDGTLILAVDEDRRAWTSASSAWDGRAVTIEVANSVAGGSWPVSDAAFDKLARLIADVATRYGFPINDDTILTHQELYIRYGASYATACPGGIQPRKAELLALANKYRSGSDPAGGGTTTVKDDDMSMERIRRASDGSIFFADELGADHVLDYRSADIGVGEVLQALTAAFGPEKTIADRDWDVAAAISQRRWAAKKSQIVNEVVSKLTPVIAGVQPVIDPELIKAAIKAGFAENPVSAEIDDATLDAIANRVADEQHERMAS